MTRSVKKASVFLVGAVLLATACSAKNAAAPSEAPATTQPAATMSPTPTEVVTDVSGAVGFQSPSHNIRCDMLGKNDAGYSVVRCEATQHVWQVPPRPANGGCTGDWYGRIVMDEDRAFFGCASEALVSGPVLPYHHALRGGTILCESSEQGIKCTSQVSGHGFTLSRQAYTLY
jgi:hypothetical protein